MSFYTGVAFGEPPRTTTTNVGNPTGPATATGTPLPYQGTPPATPSAPSRVLTAPDGKVSAPSETRSGNGGTWTLTWTALYAATWATVTKRKKVQTPVYADRQVLEKVAVTKLVPKQVKVGTKLVPKQVQVGSYTTYEKKQTGWKSVAQQVVVGFRTVYDKVQTGVRKVIDYVQRGFKTVWETVQTGWRTAYKTVLSGYRTATRQVLAGYKAVTRWVTSQRPVTRSVFAGYSWSWSPWRGWTSTPQYRTETTWETYSTPQTSYEPYYRTETYQEPVYKQVPYQEPVYQTVERRVPNMVAVERTEPVYAMVERKEPIYGTLYKQEPVYNMVPVQKPIYGTKWVQEDVTVTKMVPETVMEERWVTKKVQIGTREEEKVVTELEQRDVFDRWSASWTFKPNTNTTPPVSSGGNAGQQSRNDQLLAQQRRWWSAKISQNQAEMDAAAAEGARLRAQGATVPESQTAAMANAMLHDALLGDKHSWWQAKMADNPAGMASATAHADYLRSLGAVVSDAETLAMNRDYEAKIAAKQNQATNAGNQGGTTGGAGTGANTGSNAGSNGGTIVESTIKPTIPPAAGGTAPPPPVQVVPQPATEAAALKAQILSAKRTRWNEWIANNGRIDTNAQKAAAASVQQAKDQAAQKGIPLSQVDITEEENWDLHADALRQIKHKWWAARLKGDTAEQTRMTELANYLRGQRLGLKNQSAAYAQLAAEEGMQADGDFSQAQNNSINAQYQNGINAARQARLNQLAAEAKNGWLSNMPANNSTVAELIKAAGKPGEEAANEVTADFAAFRDALTKWWTYVDDPVAVNNQVAFDAEATMNRIVDKYEEMGLTFPGQGLWDQHADKLQQLNASFQSKINAYWLKRAGHDSAADAVEDKSIPVWLRHVSAENKAWFDKVNAQNETVLSLKEQRWELLSKVNDRTPEYTLRQYAQELQEISTKGQQARKDGSTLPDEWFQWEKDKSESLGASYQRYYRELLRLKVLAGFEAKEEGLPTIETQKKLTQYQALVDLLKPYVLDAGQWEKAAEADQKSNLGHEPSKDELRWIQALYGITGETGRYGAQTRAKIAALQGSDADDWFTIGSKTLEKLRQEHLKKVHDLWHAGKGADVAKEIKRIKDAGGNPAWVAEMEKLDQAYRKYRESTEDFYQAILTRATNTQGWSDASTFAEIESAKKQVADAKATILGFNGTPVELDPAIESEYKQAFHSLGETAKLVQENARDSDYADLLAKLAVIRSGQWANIGEQVAAAESSTMDRYWWSAVFGSVDSSQRAVGAGITELLRDYLSDTPAPPAPSTGVPQGEPARSASELRAKFEKLGWTTMVQWADEIWQASLDTKLQAEIIAAKIKQESNGDQYANAGDMAGKGLMQIEFGPHYDSIPGSNRAEKEAWVFNPTNNIHFGAKLLKGVLDKYIGIYGPEEGFKRGLQYYNFGPGAAAWVEERTKSPDEWQYWLQKYRDTHKYDPITKTWYEVESGGNYGTPTHWQKVYGNWTKLMDGTFTPPASETPSPDSGTGNYDGLTPAEGTTNTDAWVPANPPLTNSVGNRSRETYDQVINQFAVEKNPRHAPRGGDTYCNIFTWDVTSAMGAEIPHWVSREDGHTPVAVGDGKELDANASVDWLDDYGDQYGWSEVTGEEAQALANAGKPVVAVLKKPGGIGHMAVVRPGEYTAAKGATIAQAGAGNYNSTTVSVGFGRTSGVRYFRHE